MKRWEYKTVAAGYTYPEGSIHARGQLPTEEEMNALGQDGWELVCCMPEWGIDEPTLVFKRQLEAE